MTEHKKLKTDFAKKIALSPADIGSQLDSLKRRWMDDALSAMWMNIHVIAILVSGHPDLAASKHNAIICGSPAMKQWAKAELPVATSLLPKIHSYILVSQGETGIRPKSAPKRLPPDMHGRRVACTAELTRLFEEQSGVEIGPRFPWGSIQDFLIRRRLHISNWPTKSQFPNVLKLVVSSVRTEQWTNLWNQLFAADEQKRVTVQRIDIPDNEDLPTVTSLIKDSSGSTLLAVGVGNEANYWTSGANVVSVASNDVGTSGEQGEVEGVPANPKKKRKMKGTGLGKGTKRRKVVSNSIIDEDKSPHPLTMDERGDHLQLPSGDATAHTQLGPEAVFDPTWQIYDFNFDSPNPAADLFNDPPNPLTNSLDLNFSQFPDLDMSENQDLLLRPGNL